MSQRCLCSDKFSLTIQMTLFRKTFIHTDSDQPVHQTNWAKQEVLESTKKERSGEGIRLRIALFQIQSMPKDLIMREDYFRSSLDTHRLNRLDSFPPPKGRERRLPKPLRPFYCLLQRRTVRFFEEPLKRRSSEERDQRSVKIWISRLKKCAPFTRTHEPALIAFSPPWFDFEIDDKIRRVKPPEGRWGKEIFWEVEVEVDFEVGGEKSG